MFGSFPQLVIFKQKKPRRVSRDQFSPVVNFMRWSFRGSRSTLLEPQAVLSYKSNKRWICVNIWQESYSRRSFHFLSLVQGRIMRFTSLSCLQIFKFYFFRYFTLRLTYSYILWENLTFTEDYSVCLFKLFNYGKIQLSSKLVLLVSKNFVINIMPLLSWMFTVG